MPQFESSVGLNGRNLKHDVALLQACLKLLGGWSGPVDGDISRNRKAVEQGIRLLERGLKVKTLYPAQISPGSNFTRAMQKALPRDYQSLQSIKNTACLTIEAGRRTEPLMDVSALSLPDGCKADIRTLQKDMKNRLGLELVIARGGCRCGRSLCHPIDAQIQGLP